MSRAGRTNRALPLLLVPALLLVACARDDDLRRYAIVRRADVWQAVITDADRGRLARLADAWEQARADVRVAGAQADLAALGPAAGPALAQPQLPAPGAYRCRLIHLGWQQGQPRSAPAVQAAPAVPCTLAPDGVLLQLEADLAGQRHAGRLYPDVDRLIYMGSVALPGEPGRFRYGEDGYRDQFGVLEQVAPGQWRIAMPWPRWTARLTLIEISAG
jgi:hypothetical protein